MFLSPKRNPQSALFLSYVLFRHININRAGQSVIYAAALTINMSQCVLMMPTVKPEGDQSTINICLSVFWWCQLWNLRVASHYFHVRLEFDSRQGQGFFSLFATASSLALGPKPPIQSVSGVLSAGVKRLGREADHSPPFSAEVKKAWSYTSTPQVRLHGVVLKHTDNFTFFPSWGQ